MIYLDNINKSYDNKMIIKDLTYLFQSKGLVFIEGVSGEGKTTLLNIIAGLLSDFKGSLYFDSRKITSKNKNNHLQNNISYILQSNNLIKDLTLKENLHLPLKIKNLNKDVDKLTTLLGLKKHMDKKAKLLSIGEQQRASLVRSILSDTPVILLDEPTGSLNKENAQIVMKIIRKISKEKLVVLVTHNSNLIKKNDTCIKLEKGKITKINKSKQNQSTVVKKNLTKNNI